MSAQEPVWVALLRAQITPIIMEYITHHSQQIALYENKDDFDKLRNTAKQLQTLLHNCPERGESSYIENFLQQITDTRSEKIQTTNVSNTSEYLDIIENSIKEFKILCDDLMCTSILIQDEENYAGIPIVKKLLDYLLQNIICEKRKACFATEAIYNGLTQDQQIRSEKNRLAKQTIESILEATAAATDQHQAYFTQLQGIISNTQQSLQKIYDAQSSTARFVVSLSALFRSTPTRFDTLLKESASSLFELNSQYAATKTTVGPK